MRQVRVLPPPEAGYDGAREQEELPRRVISGRSTETRLPHVPDRANREGGAWANRRERRHIEGLAEIYRHAERADFEIRVIASLMTRGLDVGRQIADRVEAQVRSCPPDTIASALLPDIASEVLQRFRQMLTQIHERAIADMEEARRGW